MSVLQATLLIFGLKVVFMITLIYAIRKQEKIITERRKQQEREYDIWRETEQKRLKREWEKWREENAK